MCVSAAPASFSETILYAGRLNHPGHGPIEVLGYQNTAMNQTRGANAMLLHGDTAIAVCYLHAGRLERAYQV
ncbi:MAG: hypothetical protein QOH97_3364 [Actinoplanes sp.]|jgi:hypothetical protein|nr:hypothetical protein [Actinoplanes sp.]